MSISSDSYEYSKSRETNTFQKQKSPRKSAFKPIKSKYICILLDKLCFKGYEIKRKERAEKLQIGTTIELQTLDNHK